MKKSKANQATLFQSWGRPQTSSRASTSFEPKSQTTSGIFDSFDPDDLVSLGDEEDDDELLAAVAEIPPFTGGSFQTVGDQGRHPNSRSTCNTIDNSVEIEVIPGFDLGAGDVWIYPTNYPIRNYQYDIVEQALYKNTLVTLPTGLGKTFIAAVIMYNFYRWYPQGKVIFMAPTKPLVAQQIEACYNIMGIPQSDTAEMTGNMAPNKRQSLWQSRRVFFLTPQVLQNDLNRGSCVAEQVVLVVVDEAHKALGNHAYCQVVREISGYTRTFRVLALSATPGDALQAVQQVITNLLISHMELRSEDSPDIKPYTHSRQVDKVVVPLGEDISKIKSAYLKVLEAVVTRLFCKRVMWQKDPQRVTKFLLLTARDQFRKRMNEQGGMERSQMGMIEGDFAMCISLYHAYELLLQHGILSFYNFIKGIVDGTKGMSRAKTEITRNQEFSQLMTELREEIEPPVEDSANSSLLFSQFSPSRRALMNAPKPSSTFKSHPKLLKLKEIILEHFGKYQDAEKGASGKGVTTRVMIFSQYRDSVNEIVAMLSQHKPVVRVMSFIGQQSTGKSSRGLTQKEQLQVVQRFRQGGYNTLVATCVGEEGLDIGEVDLIICFDAHASPIRLVQRMGRTGRKRDGRIVILVTEGKEEQVYKRSQSSKKSIHKAVTQAAKSFDLYSDNHRMVPRHVTPSVLKMEMTVGKFLGHSKGKQKGKPPDEANIKKFTTKSVATTSKKSDGLLTYEELVYWQEHFKLPDHEAGLSPPLSIRKNSRRSLAKNTVTPLSLTEWLPWQTTLHPVRAVTHSRRTEHLAAVLEFTELHGGRGDDDDESYDLEMMSFLNEEDILKPGQKDCDVGEIIVQEDDGSYGELQNQGIDKGKFSNKRKKPRRKLQVSDDPTGSTSTDGNGFHGNESEVKQSTKKGEKGDDSSGRKTTRGGKKRSPKNKARWKELLKQFETEDEDFETDDAKGPMVLNKNDPGESCQPNSVHEDDLPDTTRPFEPENETMEATEEQTCLADNSELREFQIEAERSSKSGDACFSDAAPDELSSLLPTSTPDFPTRSPVFTMQRSRFAMAVVPTPPSLESLDKICSSPGSVELEELERETEVEPWKEPASIPNERGNMSIDELSNGRGSRSMDELPLSPKCCPENESLIEPFLMGDFLDDNEAKDESSRDDPFNQRHEEKGALRISTPVRRSEPCVAVSQEKAPRAGEMLTLGGRTCKDLISADSHIEMSIATDARGVSRDLDSRVIAEDIDSRGFSKESDCEQVNFKVDLLSDFGAGVWCGSTTTKECEDDELIVPVEDAAFSEVFFMDETDDDAFTNLTFTCEENGDEGDTHEPATDQRFSSDGNLLSIKSHEASIAERATRNTDRSDSETFDKNTKNNGESSSRPSGSRAEIDLKKSISKLSAFEHNSKAAMTVSDNTKEREVGTAREVNVSATATAMFSVVGARTRGEHTNSSAFHDNPCGSDSSRHSELVHVTAATTSRRGKSHEMSLKAGHQTSDPPLPRLPSHSTGIDPNRKERSHSTRIDPRRKERSHSTGVDPQRKAFEISQTTDKTAAVNGSTVPADNACRSPLPKKLKLSLKRCSPKDKEVVPRIKHGEPTGRGKALNFGSSLSGCAIPEGSNESETCRDKTLGAPKGEFSFAVEGSPPRAPAFKASSVHHEENSSNVSKLRTQDGSVVAVMESDSDDGDDEDDDIRPVGKAAVLRRRALLSPCSQEFKRPPAPGEGCLKQPGPRVSSRRIRQGSESDEEFEINKQGGRSCVTSKAVEVRVKARKRKSLEICAKQGTRKSLDSHRKQSHNRLRKNHFLDDEAVLSGSDISDFSSDEGEDGLADEMDSFIDDASQPTQKTPSRSKPHRASPPVDMAAVYRQSLMSPLCGALNFGTPAFHKQRNKYKMVYKSYDRNDESGSEAGESYEQESVLENEVGEEDENGARESGTERENEAPYRHGNDDIRNQSGERGRTHAQCNGDVSFEESQIGRPVNRMKRKRILDESFEEEPDSLKFSKERNALGNCDKENTAGKNGRCLATSNDANFQQNASPNNNVSGNFAFKNVAAGVSCRGDFVKSSDVFAEKRRLPDETLVSRRSADSARGPSMHTSEWDSDVSDSELLDALDGGEAVSSEKTSVKTPRTSKTLNDLEMNEMAVAMETTDNDVSMEMMELPTFSLRFDFLSEVLRTNSNVVQDACVGSSTRDQDSIDVKPGPTIPQESYFGNKNTADGRNEMAKVETDDTLRNENFTRISQCSKQTLGQFKQPLKNPQALQRNHGQLKKVSETNTSLGSSAISNLSLNREITARTKETAQRTGQQCPADVDAYKPQQVVTPSCRTSSLGSRPVISPLLTSSEKDRGKTVILVDSREISSSQVVSSLRLKHNIKAEVCQLTGCDYIVSNRMAVKRKTVSDVSNSANGQKLVECIRMMCDLYDRPCLIIEKDRVKPGETERNVIKSKAYLFTLASIAQTHVKMVFSDSQEETARLLTDLAAIESKKGVAITAPTSMSKPCEKVFRVLLSFPRVSYITALNLSSSYNSLQEIVNSSPADLQKRSRNLLGARAAEIHKHLRHKFNPNMLAMKK